MKLGEPTQRIDGFAGLPPGTGVGIGAGVGGVGVGGAGVGGGVGIGAGVGGGGVGVGVGEGVGLVVRAGITNTWPIQMRLGFEMLLARAIIGYLRASL